MKTLFASDLSEFVAVVDGEFGGNLAAPELTERFLPLDLKFETPVEQALDPFSDAYFGQQIALYEEIAARPLNQSEGELHPVDLVGLFKAPNPLGDRNAGFISEQVRALTTMFAISGLAQSSRVLDMGAGHGLSSEVLAFCGCQVTAADIDPELSRLAMLRASARNFSIDRQLLNFDDISSLGGGHEAAYFFQSLHHALRPWDLISALRPKLQPNGVIGFAGEPINDFWWRNWGLRLDLESLYVARKFGWFESGWTHGFIRACFERAGLSLRFYSGGLGGTDIGIASSDPGRLDQVTAKARSIGLHERRV